MFLISCQYSLSARKYPHRTHFNPENKALHFSETYLFTYKTTLFHNLQETIWTFHYFLIVLGISVTLVVKFHNRILSKRAEGQLRSSTHFLHILSVNLHGRLNFMLIYCRYKHIYAKLSPAHAGSSLGYFCTLKMEAIRSSETSVNKTYIAPYPRRRHSS
jgi:hypothetical protein